MSLIRLRKRILKISPVLLALILLAATVVTIVHPLTHEGHNDENDACAVCRIVHVFVLFFLLAVSFGLNYRTICSFRFYFEIVIQRIIDAATYLRAPPLKTLFA